MVRIVKRTQGPVVDVQQLLPGRGAYVHLDAGCVERAVKRGGLARSLRAPVAVGLLDDLAVLVGKSRRTP